MTEAEWLECTNPDVMLDHLEKVASERKLRLHGCACCRRIVHLFTDERCQTALEVSQRFADGLVSREELKTAHQAAVAVIWDTAGLARDIAQAAAWVSSANSWDAADATGRVTAKLLAVVADNPMLVDSERQEQVSLLREIMGNPFGTGPSRAEYSAEVVAIARTMYAGLDRRDLLREALTQAGHAGLADHFTAVAHPKGCWALDTILAKR
jgi:hypothetical protein